MRPWWLNLPKLVAVLVLMAVLALPSTVSADSLDDQARAIARQLQCPVCENVTVADSNAPLAQQMREIIKQKLAAGEGRDQIIQYFVDRYGPGILSRPQPSGLGLGAWWIPVIALVLGAAVLYLVVRNSRRSTAPVAPGPDLEPEIQEVLKELKSGEGNRGG